MNVKFVQSCEDEVVRIESELDNTVWMTYCSERRLHWLGHVIRMDYQHIPQQALHWEVPVFKRGPGSSAYKLEEHSQQGLVKDGNHLGGSGGGSSKQIKMASKCDPMLPLGCGLS